MSLEKTESNFEEGYVIDVTHILKVLWQRIWIIGIVGILTAAIGFSVSAFMIAPTYQSSIMLYVNNSSFSVGDVGFSISSSQLVAAQSLAKTYTVMLKNRTTLERVIEETDVNYSWKSLSGMITTETVNDTEVIRITVTSENPYEAEKIANGIAKVLPQRISEIIEGASMEVVDSAIADTAKVAPSISKFTVVGFLLGVMLAAMFFVVLALLDNTIHDEDYIINTYDYPILAKVPDLLDVGSSKYGYSKYGYGYGNYYKQQSKTEEK